MALSKKILDTYELWRTNELFDEQTRGELNADLSEKEIEDRFWRDLEFGTGGLRGVMAAGTILPVIVVPMKSSTLDGMDSLLSTVQMPSGIPVATVAINGGGNAALLACQMLAISDETLAKRLKAKRAADTAAVLEKDARICAEYSSL